MKTALGRRAFVALLSLLGIAPFVGRTASAGSGRTIEASDVSVFFAAHVIDELVPGVELAIRRDATGCYLDYGDLPVGRLAGTIASNTSATTARVVNAGPDSHGRTRLFIAIA